MLNPAVRMFCIHVLYFIFTTPSQHRPPPLPPLLQINESFLQQYFALNSYCAIMVVTVESHLTGAVELLFGLVAFHASLRIIRFAAPMPPGATLQVAFHKVVAVSSSCVQPSCFPQLVTEQQQLFNRGRHATTRNRFQNKSTFVLSVSTPPATASQCRSKTIDFVVCSTESDTHTRTPPPHDQFAMKVRFAFSPVTP